MGMAVMIMRVFVRMTMGMVVVMNLAV